MPLRHLRVVVADRLLQRFSDELAAGLGEVDWIFCDPTDDVALAAALSGAQVLVGSRLPASVAVHGQDLELVQAAGAGIDGIARDALSDAVVVANVHEHGTSIAEHVVMAMLALSRDLRRLDADLRRGIWTNPAVDSRAPLASALPGRVVGLVGYGHIGQAVADMALMLGMRAMAVRRRPELSADDDRLDFIGGIDDLGEVAARSDFLVIVVPLDERTRGLIGVDVLAAMRPDAYLINVARGPVVDEDALYDALVARRIAGAALDVWYAPPGRERSVSRPATRDFGALDNVLLTPHVSGVTDDTFRRRARWIAENLRRFQAGDPLHNSV